MGLEPTIIRTTICSVTITVQSPYKICQPEGNRTPVLMIHSHVPNTITGCWRDVFTYLAEDAGLEPTSQINDDRLAICCNTIMRIFLKLFFYFLKHFYPIFLILMEIVSILTYPIQLYNPLLQYINFHQL